MKPKSTKFLLIFLAAAATIFALLTRSVTAQPAQPGTLITTSPAPALPGTRVIFAETLPSETESILWLATAADPAQRAELARLTHAPGYPPRGAVSPDGAQLALFTLPPEESPATARTGGHEIWLAGLDGAPALRLASGAGFFGHWSPDGTYLTYGRRVALAQPNGQHVYYRTEIIRLSVAGGSANLVLANDVDYALYPLGWTPDSARYLVALADTQGVWRVEAYDPASGALIETIPLPAYQLPRRFSLSPDARSLLVEDLRDDQAVLSVFDLSGQRAQAQAELSAGPVSAEQPVSPAAGLWLPDGSLWLYRQPQPGVEPAGQVMALDDTTTGGEPVALAPPQPDTLLLPESIAPNADFRFWRLYPHNYTIVYLQQGDDTAMAAVQPSQPGNWLNLLGWSIRTEGAAHE